jgi:hypothetical protein
VTSIEHAPGTSLILSGIVPLGLGGVELGGAQVGTGSYVADDAPRAVAVRGVSENFNGPTTHRQMTGS